MTNPAEQPIAEPLSSSAPPSYSPLHHAVKNDKISEVRGLLKESFDVNTVENGLTALHLAAKKGYTWIIKELLANGADVNAKTQTKGSLTPLHIAAAKKRIGVVKVLLANGANVNEKSDLDFTPLHIAAANGYVEIVDELLVAGAVNAAATNGSTPLYLAALKGAKVIAANKYAAEAEREARSLAGVIYYTEPEVVYANYVADIAKERAKKNPTAAAAAAIVDLFIKEIPKRSTRKLRAVANGFFVAAALGTVLSVGIFLSGTVSILAFLSVLLATGPIVVMALGVVVVILITAGGGLRNRVAKSAELEMEMDMRWKIASAIEPEKTKLEMAMRAAEAAVKKEAEKSTDKKGKGKEPAPVVTEDPLPSSSSLGESSSSTTTTSATGIGVQTEQTVEKEKKQQPSSSSSKKTRGCFPFSFFQNEPLPADPSPAAAEIKSRPSSTSISSPS